MYAMKQLITRIDDELHRQIKAKAAAEGRSVNNLVRSLLEAAVRKPETRAEWKARMIAEGRVITFEPEGPVPSRDELERMSRGWGTAVSEALDWTRGEW